MEEIARKLLGAQHNKSQLLGDYIRRVPNWPLKFPLLDDL